jgi:hypothetical protein
MMITMAGLICVFLVTTVSAQTTTQTVTEKGKATVDKATQAVTGKPEATTDKTQATGKTDKGTHHSCRQIQESCQKAGFVAGEAKKGYGLHRDCINPIMQGKASVPGATKPLPAVDPKVVSECKEKQPGFESGKVGTK